MPWPKPTLGLSLHLGWLFCSQVKMVKKRFLSQYISLSRIHQEYTEYEASEERGDSSKNIWPSSS
jgi:hypothetical protein